jgi:hypothetical protein
VSGSSRFIFSTEEGTILGWSPTVDATNAIVAVPNTTGAIYKGLAIAPRRRARVSRLRRCGGFLRSGLTCFF